MRAGVFVESREEINMAPRFGRIRAMQKLAGSINHSFPLFLHSISPCASPPSSPALLLPNPPPVSLLSIASFRFSDKNNSSENQQRGGGLVTVFVLCARAQR